MAISDDFGLVTLRVTYNAQHTIPMSTIDQQPDKLSPQSNLPPVQPPSAGFIVQLFVIPALVVLCIVVVWLLFNWLAHMGGNPTSYVAAMKAGRADSGQQAYNLADELQRNETARTDPELAKDVANFLEELLAQPLPGPEQHEQHKRHLRSEEAQRRGFVCHALAQFRLPEQVLPALLKAAVPTRDKDEDAVRVRVAALEAIAILADNVRATKPLDDPRVITTFTLASGDELPIVAKAGAFGLGVVGGPEAIKQLKKIAVAPGAPDVQYNAALGLARHGDAAGLELIAEMIDPGTTRALNDEEDQKGRSRAAKQARLQLNGLRAARQLAAANANVDMTSLLPVIQRLQASSAPEVVKSEARVVERELKARK